MSLTARRSLRGPLAAAADALGRVMLLDAGTGVVLRVLKGARSQA
jgi:hypothetical protein